MSHILVPICAECAVDPVQVMLTDRPRFDMLSIFETICVCTPYPPFGETKIIFIFVIQISSPSEN